MRVAIRYSLAYWILLYAGVKIIKSEFPFPSLDALLTPYDESSPMGLLSTMMGYSTPYNVYAGLVEAVGGVLLLWRRTTALGALLGVAAMSNVVMLKVSYDVSVKIFSIHLFLMGFFLAAPGLGRVYDALVLGRAVGEEHYEPHVGGRGWRKIGLVLKTPAVVVSVGGSLFLGWQGRQSYGDGRGKPPLYGIWEVMEFTRNHESVPPLLTDSTRWRYLVVDFPERVSVHIVNGRIQRHAVKLDTTARQMAFTLMRDSTNTMTLAYATPDAALREVAGVVGPTRFASRSGASARRDSRWSIAASAGLLNRRSIMSIPRA